MITGKTQNLGVIGWPIAHSLSPVIQNAAIEAYKMSATLISISPLVLLYVFVQRKFIQGIENTGITGE